MGTGSSDLRKALAPETLAAISGSVLYVEMPKTGGQAIFVFLRSNGDYDTFVTPDNKSITVREGLVTGTRGLGNDLMTVDIDTAIPRVRQAQGRATRIHRRFNGEDELVSDEYDCDYARDKEGWVTETCVGVQGRFENRYEFGSNGQLRRSRQWIGEVNGYLEIDVLKN